MKSTISEQNKYKDWILPGLSIVTTIVPVLIQLSANSCENTVLKWVIISFLAISFMIFCYVINNASRNKNNAFKFLLLVICFLFYFLLTYYVITKKCDQPAEKLDSVIKVDNSKNSIVDNSTHYDNRKIFFSNKNVRRTINKKDVTELRSKLPEKNEQIIVQYLKTKPEDTVLWRQVFNSLSKMGYSNVHLSSATNLPDNLLPGRMTIRKETSEIGIQYRVIINPNQ